MNYRITVLVVFVSLMLAACKEKEIYSNIPKLEYKAAYLLSGSQEDSLLKLVFTFKDGDGDIGLNAADTFAPFNPQFDTISLKSLNPYYFNCYVEYEEMVDGVFKPYIPVGKVDTFQYSYRLPSLTPDGRHKSIRGDIELDLVKSPSQLQSQKLVDTVQYTIYIYDRLLHKSNKIKTPPVYWRRS
jgi:hypothetical protein